MEPKDREPEKEQQSTDMTGDDALQTPVIPDALSPEAMLRMICKQYLQIKGLQLQNEELQRSQAERETLRKQLVEALRDREWKYRALFEQGYVGLAYHEMIYDFSGQPKDFRILDANHVYIEMIEADPRGKTAAQAFSGIENDPFAWIKAFGRVVRTGEPVHFERYLPQRGQWYDCFAYQFKPDHFVAAFQNITARKKMENALKKSEKKYRVLVNYSHDIICTIIPEGIMSFVSPAWTKLLGHPVTEVTGKPLRFFVHPDDFSNLWTWLKALKETGEFLSYDEYRARHCDGAWRWFTLSAVAIRDETSALLGFYGVMRDITERKKTEKALRSSQARYHALVDQSFEALALVDVQTQEVVEINRRFTELFGYSLPEDAPLHVIDVVVESKTNLDRLYNVTLQQQSALSPRSMLLRRKNGTEVYVERAGGILHIDGRAYLLASIRDMTEERQRQKKLAESMEELRIKQDMLEKINALLVESQRSLLLQATYDSLTGLPNRRAAMDLLSRELARNKRHGEGFAIGMCVIDNFKTINDTWGHQIGDEALLWFARMLLASVREYDNVARIGGDEFLLILPLKTGVDAASVFERCRRQIADSKMKTKEGEELGITASIGVAFATVDSEMDKLLSKAESALNRAKSQGRNCVVYALKP